MFVSNALEVNSLGHLTIGGRDTVQLAQTFGTPLYVMDETEIRESCRLYRRSMDEFYGGKGLVAYACKAFCCKAMCKIAEEEGLGLDVSSAGEMHTAIAAGFPVKNLILHGNNKTMAELAMALEHNIGRIVVDNITELNLLNQLAKAAGKRPGIMLRIKPGVNAHTHGYVQTGQVDSKFGFGLETGEAMAAARLAAQAEHLDFLGIHCHIGSQILDVEPFKLAAKVMIGFLAEIKKELGVELPELNLGGGFGVRYTPDDNPPAYDSYMKEVSRVVKEACARFGLATPLVIIEPGRSIVGSAGITLYRVGEVKHIPGVRTYVSVDGGIFDNPRYALYHSVYSFVVANKASQPAVGVVTVAGKCCETGDLLGENVPLPQVEAGDMMAVLATGAYNYSMASNYNRNPRPPVLLVGKDGDRVIVRGETLDDLIRGDQ